MKTVIVIILFSIAVFALWRLNTPKKPPLLLDGDRLRIHTNGSTISLALFHSEEEYLDPLDISRHFLKLPNGDKLIYETIDFPSTYDFTYPPDAIVAKIFGFQTYGLSGKRKNILIIEGRDHAQREFAVVAVFDIVHRLQLLYPLGKREAAYFKRYLIEGKKESFPKKYRAADISIRPEWSESLLVVENMIEKDM